MLEENSIQQIDKKTIRIYFVLGAMSCCIIFVISIMLFNFFNIDNLGFDLYQRIFVSHQLLVSPSNLTTKCPIPANLPIRNIIVTRTMVSGNFQGLVKNITFTLDNLPAILTVTSLDSTQTVSFNMKLERDMLLLLTSIPLAFPLDIHNGQHISITFRCEVKTNGKFVITNLTALSQ